MRFEPGSVIIRGVQRIFIGRSIIKGAPGFRGGTGAIGF